MNLTAQEILEAACETGELIDENLAKIFEQVANRALAKKKQLYSELMIMSFYSSGISASKSSQVMARFNKYSRMTKEEVKFEIGRDEYWSSNCDIELIYLAWKYKIIDDAMYQIICTQREI